MANFKCPGCKRCFDNHRALGTHKRYCQTKITAVVMKLLEQRKVKLQERREKRVQLENVEEEREIEENAEVSGAESLYRTSVSRSLRFYSVQHLVQLARAYSESNTSASSFRKAKPQDTPSETIPRRAPSPTALHTSTSGCRQ
jgi:hypothetical protein